MVHFGDSYQGMPSGMPPAASKDRALAPVEAGTNRERLVPILFLPKY
jgi:hypothetical protein